MRSMAQAIASWEARNEQRREQAGEYPKGEGAYQVQTHKAETKSIDGQASRQAGGRVSMGK